MVTLSLSNCGVSTSQYEELQVKYDNLLANNEKLKAEIARLRETDEVTWQEAVEQRDAKQWVIVEQKTSELLSRWPHSPLVAEAKKLRRLAREERGTTLFDSAQQLVGVGNKAEARRILEIIKSELGDTSAGRKVQTYLRDLDAKLAAAEKKRKCRSKLRQSAAGRLRRCSN